MAARVVWLVANGYARPEQILGLTFTRKAAGELAHRVRTRLGQLRPARRQPAATSSSAASRPSPPTTRTPPGSSPSTACAPGTSRPPGCSPRRPAGRSPTRWCALRRRHDRRGPGAEHGDRRRAGAGRRAGRAPGHPGRAGRLDRPVLRRGAVAAGPGLRGRRRGAGRASSAGSPCCRWCGAYEQRKLDLEAMDFGDQMARAARVARDHPEVGAIERDRFRVVLLDEYQDTSHAQVVLLQRAVRRRASGDRGRRPVPVDLRLARRQRRHAGPLPGRVPRAAAAATPGAAADPELAQPAGDPAGGQRAVRGRCARPAPGSPSWCAGAAGRPSRGRRRARCACALLQTYADEADWIADSDARRLAGRGRHAATRRAGEIPVEQRPTSAVLVRVRSQIPAIEAALRARGLPVEVVGLGGLLDTPEVRDVVCTLRVLADPTDGAALLRLLTGARWRIGPRDLVALHRRARAIAAARAAAAPAGDRTPSRTIAGRTGSTTPPWSRRWPTSGRPQAVLGRGVSRGCGRTRSELAVLRHRLDQPLPDLIADVERTIGLDVEVAVRGWARRRRGPGPRPPGRARRRGGPVRRRGRGRHAGRLPGLPGRGRGGGARARRRARSTWSRARCRSSPRTPPRAWSGTWSRRRADQGRVAGPGPELRPLPDGHRRAAVPAARRRRRAAAARPVDGAADQKDGAPRRSSAFSRAVARARRAGGAAAGVRGGHPAAPAAALLRATGGATGEAGRAARRCSSSEIRRPLRRRAPAWSTCGRRSRRRTRTNPTAAEVAPGGVAGRPAGRAPAGDGRGGRRWSAQILLAPGDRDRRRPTRRADRTPPRRPGAEPRRRAARRGGAPRRRTWRREADLLLAERDGGRAGTGRCRWRCPAHLSVSQLVALRRDPQALARSLRRPLPAAARPVRPARHRLPRLAGAALRRRRGCSTSTSCPAPPTRTRRPTRRWPSCRSAFLASEWADRTPVEVEVPFATVDRRGGGPRPDGRGLRRPGRPVRRGRLEDRPPARPGPTATAAAVQLAAYRMAWAALAGVPVERVRAGVPLRARRRHRAPGRPARRRRAGRADRRRSRAGVSRSRATARPAQPARECRRLSPIGDCGASHGRECSFLGGMLPLGGGIVGVGSIQTDVREFLDGGRRGGGRSRAGRGGGVHAVVCAGRRRLGGHRAARAGRPGGAGGAALTVRGGAAAGRPGRVH